jgi:hypothetical protein
MILCHLKSAGSNTLWVRPPPGLQERIIVGKPGVIPIVYWGIWHAQRSVLYVNAERDTGDYYKFSRR